MVDTSMPAACNCLRCTIVLIGSQRRLLRAELLDKVVRTEQREIMAGRLQGAMLEYQDAAAHGYRAHADRQEADIDRAGRFAPLRKEALDTNDRDVVQLDTQWLCPAGRRGQLVKRLVSARKVGAMMSLGVVCRVLHFVAMLLQQPWPIRWRDDRAIAREAFAEERADRGKIEMLELRFRRGYAKAFEREMPADAAASVDGRASRTDDDAGGDAHSPEPSPPATGAPEAAKPTEEHATPPPVAIAPSDAASESSSPPPQHETSAAAVAVEDAKSPTSLGRRRVSFHPKAASPSADAAASAGPLIDIAPQTHVVEYDPHDAPSMLSSNFDPEMMLLSSGSDTTTESRGSSVSPSTARVKPPAALVPTSPPVDPKRPLGIAGLRPIHIEAEPPQQQQKVASVPSPRPAAMGDKAADAEEEGDAAPLVKVSAPSFHPVVDHPGTQGGGGHDPARLGTAESPTHGHHHHHHQRGPKKTVAEESFAGTFTLGESARPQPSSEAAQHRLRSPDTQASSMMSDGSFTLS
jgi:hypothetical protein